MNAHCGLETQIPETDIKIPEFKKKKYPGKEEIHQSHSIKKKYVLNTDFGSLIPIKNSSEPSGHELWGELWYLAPGHWQQILYCCRVVGVEWSASVI